MAVTAKPRKSARPPLDYAALERLALHYVERYATTRAKLRAYLSRKLAERGWEGEAEAPVAALVEKITSLGYVNDRLFAEARAASLSRRGFGVRRVHEALRIAGVEESDATPAREVAVKMGWEAALAFAKRKKIGPFGAEPSDENRRRKQLAAMLRAGHSFEFSRILVRALPGECPADPN